MRFSHDFIVPLPPAEAWTTLMNIPAIAPCMPGAELTEKVDDQTYKGKVSVKLGPVALTFSGTAKFEDVDDAAHAATVKAQGTDMKGRGGGAAAVKFHLEPHPDGSKVLIDTNLSLSGAVAQYGRGVGLIQNVAAQIIGQFASNLKKQVQESARPPGQATGPKAPAAEGAAHTALARTPEGVGQSAAPHPVKPIGGFLLFFRALLATIRGHFGKA
jgi:carbon monoxide dehydrogenase subunit G